MARRYEIDELLWLRSSPLVAKPPGLPPIEEWMYVPSISPPAGIPHAHSKTDPGASPPGLNPTQPPSANNKLLVTRITQLKSLQTEDLAFSNLAISHGAPIQVCLFPKPCSTGYSYSPPLMKIR